MRFYHYATFVHRINLKPKHWPAKRSIHQMMLGRQLNGFTIRALKRWSFHQLILHRTLNWLGFLATVTVMLLWMANKMKQRIFSWFIPLPFTGHSNERYTISIPIIGDNNVVFTGVGDVFAALFLAHSATKSNLAEALEYTIATVQSVLKNTLNAISATCGRFSFD